VTELNFGPLWQCGHPSIGGMECDWYGSDVMLRRQYFLTLLKSRGDKIDCGFFFTNTQNIIKLHEDW